MGSDNAKKVHRYGGSLTGNQYKVLTHMAWVSYDRRGIPKGGKDRDGNTAKPLQFFGNAQASALEALGRDKKPAVALRLWERAVKELTDLGIIKVVERAIPNKRTARYELDLGCLETGREAVDNFVEAPEVSEQKVREPSEQKVREPVEDHEQKVRQTPEVSEQKVRAYLQGSTNQVEASNQKDQLTSRSRRAVSSPRARGTLLLAQDDDSTIYDNARQHLGNLGPDRSDHYMDKARQDLGTDAPLRERVIHAAALAGWQEQAAS
ncbi:hypothetical protein [Arthrobacter sp. SDTb3-6]|uniref:hypothetical protein n=1 Tax=Arthrobacter sp. SDTb3-6 TaxID=2713571 RepID=UPI00159D49AD|nr:hypothetical protein [Arthrobacter sp. SDTb3-6]NVM97677.1 hypothetical protein [Arthrobacter sp. SDTb3-6]